MIRSLTAFTMFLTASAALAASPRLRLGWEFCITHGKTPKIETAKRLIAIAADLGYEEIHLFSKAAFLYEKHPEPSRDRSPYTWADVRALDDFRIRRRFRTWNPGWRRRRIGRWPRRPRRA